MRRRRCWDRTHRDIRTIRPMRDGVIADFEIAEGMLREFIKKIHAQLDAQPAHCGLRAERRDGSGKAGGARQRRTCGRERSAISSRSRWRRRSASGSTSIAPVGNMVVDIGGGTTEIAVIALVGHRE